MTAGVAFLFPGQGAQSPGFVRALRGHPAVNATLGEACDAMGASLEEIDSENALRSTVAVQLSTLIAGVAASRALTAEGIYPTAVAGLSIGTYGAAVACGALVFRDALRLAQLRAEYMQQAYPRGYGMAAITGLTEKQLMRCIRRADATYIANVNAPRQIVVAGSDAGLETLMADAQKAGARTVRRLDVAVPSHCVLQNDAASQLAEAFDGVKLEPPRIPYVDDRGGRARRTADAIRVDLATNLAHPVRWHDATCVLYELGAKIFVEMPPGRALSDLAREAFPDVHTFAVEGQAPAAIARALRRTLGHEGPGGGQ